MKDRYEIGSPLLRFTVAALTVAVFAATAAAAETSGNKSAVKKEEKWSNPGCGGTTIKRVPNKRKKYRVPANSMYNYDRHFSDHEVIQNPDELKNKLETLRRIHEIQKKLLRNGGKMSSQQQKRLRGKIRQLQKSLEKDIAAAPDFPFATQMPGMDQVVEEIVDGRSAEFQELAGQTPQKILDEIHDRQIRALTRKVKKTK